VPPKKTLFIVDDHPVFREGLARLLGQEEDLSVCGEAVDAAEALKRIAALKPDLAMIDISLEGVGGLDLVKMLRDRYPAMRLLVVSMHPESLYAERALRAGANGYIMKRESGRALISAVRHVLGGKTHISAEINERLLARASRPGSATEKGPVDGLSDRELEVFHLIGEGFGTRQIAEKLGVSMKTVETHREHIKEKLGLSTTVELVQRAIHWIHHEKPS
jgi:DNA-binding NarL/FixJ family response regulator